MKQYSFITFVNVGNGTTGIEPTLINLTMSDVCLEFDSTRVIINSLKSMNWTLSLFSVGESNNLKVSSSPVKLIF